jgi:hypothetical protein
VTDARKRPDCLVNSAIGINFPPVGFCLYIGASIAEVPLEAAARYCRRTNSDEAPPARLELG